MRISLTSPTEKTDRHEIEQDATIQQVATMTPKQAGQWVDNNVTDLAPATKKVLKWIAMICVWLVRRELNK